MARTRYEAGIGARPQVFKGANGSVFLLPLVSFTFLGLAPGAQYHIYLRPRQVFCIPCPQLEHGL